MRIVVANVATILTLISALRVVDEIWGWAVYNEPPHANVLEQADSKRVIVQLVGFTNDGDVVGDLLGEKFRQVADASVVTLTYGEHDFNIDELYQLVMGKVGPLQPKQLMFYGGSMGGGLAAVMAQKYEQVGAPHGKLLLLLDCAAGSVNSTKLPIPKWLFSRLRWIGGGPIATTVKAPIVRRQLGGLYPREPDLDPATIRAHEDAMVNHPWPAMAAQAKFMAKFNVADRDLSSIVSRAWFVTSAAPDADPLVDGRLALTEWSKAIPGLVHVIDRDREPDEHNTAAERPSFIADLANRMFDAA